MSDDETRDELSPLVSTGLDTSLVEEIMTCKANNPSQFASYWEMDEEDVNEATEEEIQRNPVLKFLWAAENNKFNVLKELLEGDTSLVHGTDDDLYTALHRSAYEGHVHIMKYLLEHGANIHARTIDGWTPLHSASNWGQTDAVSLLLTHGSDVNAQTNGKHTALHLAAANTQSKATIEVLLLHPGIDYNLVNGQQETATQVAMRCSKHAELFDMCHDAVNILQRS